jgi:diaminopimelate epimerase
MENLDIVRADPAGNITIFVLNGQNFSKAERTAAVKLLFADKELRAEQVGFVYAPESDGALWRLSMTGGEFCGNAARSFGLFVARKLGLSGKQTFNIEVSGATLPVTVNIDCDTGEAAAKIQPPFGNASIVFENNTFPVYNFSGITHIIVENILPDKAAFLKIKELFENQYDRPAALGVMFYDSVKKIMRPSVYVYAAESLVFESSCGSGSAAFACYHLEKEVDGDLVLNVKQPGGVITAHIIKQSGLVKNIKIGGFVGLSELSFKSLH